MGYDGGPKFTLVGAAPLTRPLAEKNFHIGKDYLTLPISACKILDFLAVIVSEI